MAIVLLVRVELGLVGAGSVVRTRSSHSTISSAPVTQCEKVVIVALCCCAVFCRPFVQLPGFGLGDASAWALEVRLRHRKSSQNAPVRLTNNSRNARDIKGGVTRMIKLLAIAALAAVGAAPAFAQTVPSNALVITVPVFVQTVPPPGGVIGAGPRQTGPVVPGTSTVPGPVFPSMAQKSLDSPSGH